MVNRTVFRVWRRLADAKFRRTLSVRSRICPVATQADAMTPAPELLQVFTFALATIQARVPPNLVSPKVGIVFGSSLGDSIREKVVVPYSDLEGFGE
jgi:hypothetical protein